jgi:glucoamylase
MKRNINLIAQNTFRKTIKNLCFNRKTSVSICVHLWLIFFCFSANAQTLAPGKDAHWATAGKQAIGTSANLESKVWFTLAQGAMTEVYYPGVTTANVHKLEFVVVNPKTKKVETETNDAQKIIVANGDLSKMPTFLRRMLQERMAEFNFSKSGSQIDVLYFNQANSSKDGKWIILKSYITDPKSNTVMLRVRFVPLDKELQLYVYYDPSLANTGMHDTAWSQGEALLARDKDISSALIASSPLSEISNSFYDVSDGLKQLKTNGKIATPYARAENGNVVQIAKVNFERGKEVDFALSFGKTPDEALQTVKDSLAKGFDKTLAQYTRGWSDYVKTIPKVEAKYQAQFNMAAMVLKASEDKTVRGANVASLTIPWGGGANANEDMGGGYHLVWSRDLYQVVTAYMALGDAAAANRALDFLFNIQQKADGSFPQNSWLDGRPSWNSLQLDEVAYPLILAYQLNRFDKQTYENHVKKAADFIVKTGPKTTQERWEEKSGYSPSTIAAEIAGLVCAAEIAKKNGDEASATIYLATADDWARNVERWTATTRGKYGDGNYYLRLTENGTPDAGEKTVLNNGAGTFLESEIVDAGFLELVRLGIKSPDDPLIQKSMKIIDEQIKVNTPNGEGFYRYNHDGYGEMDDGRRWNWDGKYTGKGRIWALLSGERGQYELARCFSYMKSTGCKSNSLPGRKYFTNFRYLAEQRLDAMAKFANDGLMIPEQVWDKAETPKNIDKQYIPDLKFGEGTGSATPLAWSMAQFIRLAVNLQAGRNMDTPDVVYNRYVKNKTGGQTGFNITSPVPKDLAKLKAGETFTVKGTAAPNATMAYILGEQRLSATVDAGGNFVMTAKMPETETPGLLAVMTPDGDSFVSVNKIGGMNRQEKLPAETIEKIKNANQSPLVENGKAIFFYRGAARQVSVAGDMTGWQPNRISMQDAGENLKAVALDFPASTRAEYKLIVDGKWILDTANPNKLDNGVGGENSVFTMPEYKATNWDNSEGMTKYGIGIERVDSKIYGEREVKVYVPEGLQNQSLPVLYLQDGTDYRNRADAVFIQRNLVKAGKVKPFIMVFIDPKDRTKEYWASDDYAKFLATEVVPAIDKQYNTVKNRDGRAILGASLGGITSVWAGLKYPETFSRVGGQSSSFWVDNQRVIKELEKLDVAKTPFRFYFDTGTLEGVENSRRVNLILRGKGFPVTYEETESGHNWTAWRDRLADAFVALWK